MLRALTLTLLVLVAAPASAGEHPGAIVAQAQENKAPPQAPKRDCDRSQEGVSA